MMNSRFVTILIFCFLETCLISSIPFFQAQEEISDTDNRATTSELIDDLKNATLDNLSNISNSTNSIHLSTNYHLEQSHAYNSKTRIFKESDYNCKSITCLCKKYGGSAWSKNTCLLSDGTLLKRALRKEYRVMTDDERNRFHSAVQKMKKSGEYDYLSSQHMIVANNSGAHAGPSFLLWHREFLNRIEIALRTIDPNLFVPYWDSVMDSRLPVPQDSLIWTKEFLGEHDEDGNVIIGPFSEGFKTLEGNPYITRHVGELGRPFNEDDINSVMAQNTIEEFLAYPSPLFNCPFPPAFDSLEFRHANPHAFVGGDMELPLTAGNDPTFWLHHGFVDLLFETWRQIHQSRENREVEYPPNNAYCGHPGHFLNATMRPFSITNNVALSNDYTDKMYSYAERPVCSKSIPTGCGSRYLFCDTRSNNPVCIPKVKPGGNCEGFAGLDACWESVCIKDTCVFDETQKLLINATKV